MNQIPLSLEQARDRGAAGMVRSAERNERKNAGWPTLALQAVVTWVRAQPPKAEFTMEDCRIAIEDDLAAPTDRRAWGAVTQTAIRAMYIERTGGFAPAVSSNASPKPLYRRGRGLL
jgi:hypothetical protein